MRVGQPRIAKLLFHETHIVLYFFICPFQEKPDKSFNFKILQLLNMQGAGQVVSISVLEAKASRVRPLSYV